MRRDQHSPSGPVIDFPVELYDGRTVSAQAESQVLAEIPTAAIDYTFIRPELVEQARQWLDEERNAILTEALERE